MAERASKSGPHEHQTPWPYEHQTLYEHQSLTKSSPDAPAYLHQNSRQHAHIQNSAEAFIGCISNAFIKPADHDITRFASDTLIKFVLIGASTPRSAPRSAAAISISDRGRFTSASTPQPTLRPTKAVTFRHRVHRLIKQARSKFTRVEKWARGDCIQVSQLCCT